MPQVAQGQNGKDTLLSAPWFEEREQPPPAAAPELDLPGPSPAATAAAVGGAGLFLMFAGLVLWLALG